MNKLFPSRNNDSLTGFTTVELLVTLFVAAMFLAAGYMFYNAILLRSSEARWQSQADNIAYDYLRRYEALASVPCVANTPVNQEALTGDAASGLANPRVTVQVTCPISSLNRISKITVTVNYGQGGAPSYVRHEVYASE